MYESWQPWTYLSNLNLHQNSYLSMIFSYAHITKKELFFFVSAKTIS